MDIYKARLKTDRIIIDDQIESIERDLRLVEGLHDPVSQKRCESLRRDLVMLRRAKLDIHLGIPLSSTAATKAKPVAPSPFTSGRQGRGLGYETRGPQAVFGAGNYEAR